MVPALPERCPSTTGFHEVAPDQHDSTSASNNQAIILGELRKLYITVIVGSIILSLLLGAATLRRRTP